MRFCIFCHCPVSIPQEYFYYSCHRHGDINVAYSMWRDDSGADALHLNTNIVVNNEIIRVGFYINSLGSKEEMLMFVGDNSFLVKKSWIFPENMKEKITKYLQLVAFT